MQIDLPDGLSPDVTMMVTISYLMGINKTITHLTLERDGALSDKAALSNKLSNAEARERHLQTQVNDLARALEEAQKPPPAPPVQPPPPAPNTRKDVWPEETAFNVSEIVGATIENSMTSPSSTQYTAVKRAADALEAFGITTVRFYLGPMEVFGHLDPEGHMFGKFGNLVDYVRAKKMHFIADGFDRVVDLLSASNEKLKIHVEGLKQLRTWALCWNDADKVPVSQLKDEVARVRAAGWDGPIIFSLRATAKLAEYDIPGVYLEIQTFGSEDEFDDYAESSADLLCLDTRQPQTKQQIERIFDVALKEEAGRPRGYFLYTSKTRDWAATPDDEVAEIRDFTKRAKQIDIAQAQP